ncbi:ATP-binding protein [Lacibacterium aquatile]|uniref:histidine kinase n=1 Tax=Lacibacterium aquatile TaxID=1168082 RepID=A0ABW5DM20_9PROT
MQVVGALTQLLLELCGLFVALLLVRVLLDRLPTQVGRLLYGFCLGGAALVALINPVNLGSGVIADVRTSIITVAAMFGGPVVGIIPAAMTSAYRFYLGGNGVLAGIVGNLGALLIGLTLYHLTIARQLPIRLPHLAIGASGLGVALLLAFTFLPFNIVFTTMEAFAGPVILMNVLGVFMLGGLLLLDERRREMAIRLAAAESEARSTSEAKSRFLALMSHEIRTPMTAIMGMARLLSEEPLGARQMEFVRALRSAGDNMMTLLNEVLDVSRLEAGRVTIQKHSFELIELLNDLKALYTPQATAKGLEFRLELPTRSALWLSGDAIRIRQVLSNLLNNALKFTTSGSVTLCCTMSNEDSETPTLRFCVRDTGTGIPPEKLDTLFTPFLQPDTPSRNRRLGSGLGLAISRDLSKLMGGTLGVSSIVGVGSEFWLSLSLPRTQPVAQLFSEPMGGGRLRILLAEDVPANQMLLREVLTRSGHIVDIVGNGRAAVDAVRRQGPYDLVLMDSHMPEMDGLSATRAIRQLPAPPPVVAMTADTSIEARHALEDAGVNDILPKPVPWPDLLAMVARYSTLTPSVA